MAGGECRKSPKSNHKSLPSSSRVTLGGKAVEGGTGKNFRFLASHQEKLSVGVLSRSPNVWERKPPGWLQHQPLPTAPHRRPRAGPAKLGSVCTQNYKKILVMTVTVILMKDCCTPLVQMHAHMCTHIHVHTPLHKHVPDLGAWDLKWKEQEEVRLQHLYIFIIVHQLHSNKIKKVKQLYLL